MLYKGLPSVCTARVLEKQIFYSSLYLAMEEVTVTQTDQTISGGQKAAELPGKVRIRNQLGELLDKLDVSNVFEAAAGTIVGLPRETTDPQGRSANYFRIDLQQDPQPDKPLNIQYQVSGSTVACVLVDCRVKDFGVSGIGEGLRKSLDSGSYPVKGKDNGGTPLHIYSVKVEKKKEETEEKVTTSSSAATGSTKQERKAQRKAEEEEASKRRLAAMAAGLGKKPAKKDGK